MMDRLKPKLKKTATSSGKPKRVTKKGKKTIDRSSLNKYTQIMNLPVDVFLEIACYLRPLDLLHLAQASKGLRSTLMSKNMRPIWVLARRHLDPPLLDCPSDVSEPLYAALLFGDTCLACGASADKVETRVSYAARVRFCVPCWNVNIRPGTAIMKELGIPKDADMTTVIFNMLPKALQAHIPNNCKSYTELNQSPGSKYYEAELVFITEKYKEIRAKSDMVALQEYVAERAAMALERVNFQAALFKWEQEYLEIEEAREEAIAAERESAVIEKLREDGYEPEDFPQGEHVEFDQLVYEPSPLTQSVWRDIRPRLIQILEAERKRREEEAFRQKWRGVTNDASWHYKQLLLRRQPVYHPSKPVLPSPASAVELPCMRSLITSVDLTARGYHTVTAAQVAAIKPDILRECESIYRVQVLSHLVKLLREIEPLPKKMRTKDNTAVSGRKKRSTNTTSRGGVVGSNGDDDQLEEPIPGAKMSIADYKLLDRPTSLFRCTKCTRDDPMTFTELLEHLQYHQWRPSLVCLASAEERKAPLKVLKALGLPETCTLFEFERIARAPGEMACSCGQLDTQTPATMGELVFHCFWKYASPDYPRQGEHHIKLVPWTKTRTVGAQAQATK